MKTLYIEPNCGVAGDMLVAALLKLSDPSEIDKLRIALKSMPISEEWDISLSSVERHAISASLFDVKVKEAHHHSHNHHHDHKHGRTLPEIEKIINSGGNLSNTVKAKACKVFAKLADAEAKVHGKSVEHVHFHEVGAVDAIIDIVACCCLLEHLNLSKIISSPIALGRGTIKSAHGVLPVPVPATLNLIENLPVFHTKIESELATPTGTALLAVIVDEWDISPVGRVKISSYGAGTRDLKERAAIIRTSIYETYGDLLSCNNDKVAVIECNIDDMSGEIFSWITPKLFDLGALDVLLLPAQMKKNRPATLLQVLCKPGEVALFADFLLHESTTLGIRYRIENRIVLNRKIRKIETPWGEALLKEASDMAGRVLKSKVEFESCAKLAEENNIPYLEMERKLISFIKKS